MRVCLCVCALDLADSLPLSLLKAHEPPTHKHTCYGADAFSTYALVDAACGVFYSLPLGKNLNIFIALALYVKVHVVPTCIAQRPFSEHESERQGGGTERDRRRIATNILVNGDEEFGINTVYLCVVCVCERACEGNAEREREGGRVCVCIFCV